ncbi:chemokine-like receptor 1 [Rana temporaria]|uniref:chemokine-like receptor 1 n=1 Tax=Rana temporaria TaxID=8407 RepID=UPI001AAD9866|nr:chemokine-like receptor 1 [Rana temporaria]
MSGSMEIDTTEDREFDMTLNKIINVSYMVGLSGICLLGITGNGLVIWFVAFKMKKTVNSVWFLSLAFADFTFSLFLPLTITHIALDGHWPFGSLMCKLNNFILYLNLSASVLQLTVISIDRCISVVFPVWCRNHRTVRLAVKVIVVLWIVSLLLNVYYIIHTHADTYADNDNIVFCNLDWSMHKTQVIIRFITLFVVPFTVIIFCYTLIFLRIQRNPRITSTKPFKVIAAVIISFGICWFPYHVFSIMNSYEMYHGLRLEFTIGFIISDLLAFSNSCVNPLLYVFIGQDFKQKFWSAIKSGFERTFTEDPNLTDPNRRRDLPDHAISQM